MCRRKKRLYFFFSTRFVWTFLFRVAMYRDTGLFSFRASVHSKMMYSLGIDPPLSVCLQEDKTLGE